MSIFPVSASVGQVFNSYIFDGTSWNINNSIFENYLEESNASATYLDKISASTTYATKTELENIDLSSASAAAVTYLVDSAPETLNTLNELSAALNDDANFASTVSTSLGNKLDISSASTIYQPLDNDLTALSSLSEVNSGILRRESGNWLFDNSSYISVAPPGFRNKIINGDFRINQRNYIKNTNLASGSYGFDRWKSTFTNTSLDFASVPNGQIVTISDGGSIEQVIEQANVPAGGYVLSWTGTATGRVYNSGSTPPSYAASPITVYLDGTQNVEVEFTASGGTKTLHNVQLEQALISVNASFIATPFEQRPIGTELSLCQRYFARLIDPAGSGVASGGTTAGVSRCSFPLPSEMRVNPTSISVSGTWNVWNGSTVQTATYAGTNFSNKGALELEFNLPSAYPQGQAIKVYIMGSSSKYVDVSAEL
jgi:hypothetical protein